MPVTKEQVLKEVALSRQQCPGGYGCMCCNVTGGCDCGCRDDCPKFIGMIRGQLERENRIQIGSRWVDK